MSSNLVFKSVADPRLEAEAFERTKALVKKLDQLRLEALKKRGWVAVPVESAGHFNENDAGLLAQAMNGLGCRSCVAVVTDDVRAPRVFRVAATSDGLLEFSLKCGVFNAALLPEKGDLFVVLCSVDDYFLIAGPPAFVTAALPESIAEARATFAAIASEKSWPPEARRKLTKVAEVYGRVG